MIVTFEHMNIQPTVTATAIPPMQPKKKRTWSILGALAVVGLVFGIGAGVFVASKPTRLASQAATPAGTVMTFNFNTPVFNNKNKKTLLKSQAVPAQYIGKSCSITVVSRNNESVHNDNNLIFESGTDMVEVKDVERASFQQETASKRLFLGTKIDAYLYSGPASDGIFSAGFDVYVHDCLEPTPTPAPSPTATPIPTPTIVPQCGNTCATNAQCPTNHSCSSGKCVLSSCLQSGAQCDAAKCKELVCKTPPPVSNLKIVCPNCSVQ